MKKGVGLQILSDLLTVVFADSDSSYRERIRRCFKVHIGIEEKKDKPKRANDWLTTLSTAKVSAKSKIINYWCFSPGFG